MLLGAGGVLGILDMYRLIWISGKFGGHKTALAFRLAEDYLKKGYRLITNNKTVWADNMNEIDLNENNQLHAVLLLDEGGLYFKSTKQIELIAAYARKMDCIYIIPSIFPPAKIAQIVNIQPVVSLKSTGLPIILYKWTIRIGQYKDNGWFIWWNPSEIYGIYSTNDPGSEPDIIVDYLIEKTEQYRRSFGHDAKNKLSQLVEITEGDKILEASTIIQNAFEEVSIPNRKGRKR